MISLIDIEPMNPGWGKVYQSGVIASENWDNKGLIISMIGNTNFRGPCFWISMVDNEEDTLPDESLIEIVDSAIVYLKNGDDVLIHCFEGKYRSTYLDVAVHMRGARISFEESYFLVVNQHPIAKLRTGTREQLQRMESFLTGGSK